MRRITWGDPTPPEPHVQRTHQHQHHYRSSAIASSARASRGDKAVFLFSKYRRTTSPVKSWEAPIICCPRPLVQGAAAMRDAPASARASSGDTASSSASPPATEKVDATPNGPTIDPAEPFRWVWSFVVGAFTKVDKWYTDDVLGNVLPLLFELAGRDSTADAVRVVLTRGHPKRARLVLSTGLVSATVLVIVAIAFFGFFKALVTFVWRDVVVALVLFAKQFVVHALWDPTWWATAPAIVGIVWQRKLPWARDLWPHFLLIYFANGGWWGLAGCLTTTLVCACTALTFWIDCAFFLAFELTVRNGWFFVWAKVVVGLLVLAAWGLLALLALAGFARAQAEERVLGNDPNSPILRVMRYPDAFGEVQRVLECEEYFSVLEVPVTADDAEIKKSYRKKVVLTHPDKNPGAAHCNEAFDRVKTAFIKIGGEKERKEYLDALVEAHVVLNERREHAHQPQHSNGQYEQRRPEPAPRSQGPKGRKGRRHHRR